MPHDTTSKTSNRPGRNRHVWFRSLLVVTMLPVLGLASAAQVAHAVAPDTSITANPPATSTSRDATFAFTGTDGTTGFECNLDGFNWESCTSPQTYTGLINAAHTFEVRAINAAAEADATPASHSWTVNDGTPSGPRRWYVDNLRFDSGAVATGYFDYNPQPFNPLAGQYGVFSNITIDVTATNGTVREFRNVNRASRGNARYLSLVAATDNTGDLTGIPFLALTPATDLTTSGGSIDILPGPANLSYLGTCRQSNCGPADSPYEEALAGGRLIADGISFTSAPSRTSPHRDATFEIIGRQNGADLNSFECNIDEWGWEPCTSPKTYTGLINASHTLQVRSTGTAPQISAGYSWTVNDGTPSGPRRWYVDNLRFDSGAIATGYFDYNPQPFVPLAGQYGVFSNITIDVTATNGTVREFRNVNRASRGNARYLSLVAATDNTGDLTGIPFLALTPATDLTTSGGSIDILPGPANLSYLGTCRQSNCGPADSPYEEALAGGRLVSDGTSISSAPLSPTTSRDATFEFIGRNGDTIVTSFECNIDEWGWEPCTSPQTYTGLINARHTFNVRAAGTAAPTSASHTWTVDDGTPNEPRRWYVDNLRFDSGAVATGYFDYNPQPFNPLAGQYGVFSNITIDVTATNGTVREFRNINRASRGNARYLSLVAATDNTGDLTGIPFLALTPATDLTTAGGTIDILPGPANLSYLGTCRQSNCGPADSPYEEALAGGRLVTELDSVQTWFLDGVTFEDDSTAGGTFRYEAASTTYTLPRVTLTDDDGTTTVLRRLNPSRASDTQFVWLVEAGFDEDLGAADLTDRRALVLELTEPLPQADGTVQLVANPAAFNRYTCSNADCSTQAGPLVSTTAGRVTTFGTETPDTTAPVVTVPTDIEVTSATGDAVAVDFAVTALDDLDGPLTPTCTSASGDMFPLGTTMVTCEARDAADNVGTSSFDVVVLLEDTTPPTASPTLDPTPNAASWNNGDVTVTWNWADDGRGIDPTQCAESNTAFGTGEFPLLQSCVDLAGNVGIGRVELKIDRTAPQVELTTGPPELSASAEATFTFDASDSLSGLASVECSIDGAPKTPCTSPFTMSVTPGAHQFVVTATDVAGNGINAASDWTYAPVLRWFLDGITFEDGSRAVGSFRLQAATGSNSGAHVTTILPDGSRVTHRAFNPSQISSDQFAWFVEAGLEEDLAGVDLTGRSAVVLEFTEQLTDAGGSVDVVASPLTFNRYTCANADCSAPAGPFSSAMAGRVTTDIVDTEGPVGIVTISPEPNAAGWHTQTLSVTVEWIDDNDTEPRDESEEPCFDSFTLPEGPVESQFGLGFGCLDEFGNFGGVTVDLAFDNVDPETSIDIAPEAVVTDTTATFQFSAVDRFLAGFECRLDGGPWESCTSPVEFVDLALGDHTVEVRAFDEAGNIDATPATANWTIAPPNQAPTITSGDSASVAENQTAAIDVDASDDNDSAGSGLTFSLTGDADQAVFNIDADNGIVTFNEAPDFENPGDTDGDNVYEIEVTATDSGGLTASQAITITVNDLDEVAPVLAAKSINPEANAAGWHHTALAINYVWSDGGGSGITPGACPNRIPVNPSDDGEFTVAATCTDNAGNESDTDATDIEFDATEPDSTITSGPDDTVVESGSHRFTFTGSDNLSGLAGFECRIDNGNWNACTSPVTVPQLANGDHTFNVRATDVAGNTDGTPATFGWVVDIQTCLGKQVTITGSGRINGTSGDDVIIGSGNRDIISGLGGDDTICALGGNDIVRGSSGDDRIDGGSGNDIVLAGSDNDTVTDPAGTNLIFGQGGNDTLSGGRDIDYLHGGRGADTLNGFGSNDWLVGSSGNDTLNGGSGDDRHVGGSGDDTLNGGSGNDRLFDTLGTNTHIGGPGDRDRCTVGPNDTVTTCENTTRRAPSPQSGARVVSDDLAVGVRLGGAR